MLHPSHTPALIEIRITSGRRERGGERGGGEREERERERREERGREREGERDFLYLTPSLL